MCVLFSRLYSDSHVHQSSSSSPSSSSSQLTVLRNCDCTLTPSIQKSLNCMRSAAQSNKDFTVHCFWALASLWARADVAISPGHTAHHLFYTRYHAVYAVWIRDWAKQICGTLWVMLTWIRWIFIANIEYIVSMDDWLVLNIFSVLFKGYSAINVDLVSKWIQWVSGWYTLGNKGF